MSSHTVRIPASDLCIGHYVILELSWLEHPFSFNKFRIGSNEQLAKLRALGVRDFLVDLARSDGPRPSTATPPVTPPSGPGSASGSPAPAADPGQAEAVARKRERIAQNQALRGRVAAAERQFMQGAKVCRDIARTLFSNPRASIGQAAALIGEVADAILVDRDAIVHLLGDRVGGEEVYHHSMNVATLSMLLGRELGLPRDTLQDVGLAAVLHDLGKADVPTQILMKKDPWTAPERELYRRHVEVGADLARHAGVTAAVVSAIAEHHEYADGSGYPKALKGAQTSVAGRLLSVVNEYDNLCNPTDLNKAMTPHEALSLMFSRHRARFDNAMLSKLVHMLGVYPPGSVVTLSNDSIGMVLSVNASKPLRPIVMVYDEAIPKAEAITVNLEHEPDTAIVKALRPSQLARPVYDYLSPRQRITYAFDEHPGGGRP